jgi:hypothetical protein
VTWGGIILAVQGGRAAANDSRVVGDLKSLLDQHSIAYTDVTCTHQSGNHWGCLVTINGQQQFAQVTDDGHSIYEQGIAIQ